MLLLLFIFIPFISLCNGYIIPLPNCNCDLNDTRLIIQCNSNQANFFNFSLPNLSLDTNLTKVEIIIAEKSSIQNIPINICDYASVKQLDLSDNLIGNTLTSLNCLKNLISLDLSNNRLLFLNSDAFSTLNNLTSLDLRNNQIQSIPNNLFSSTLVSLGFIQLSNNSLSEFEMWPFTLPSVRFVDLRYNNLNVFTNKFGLFIGNGLIYSSNFDTATIDLRFNKLTTFDDPTIQQYGVGSYSSFKIFMNITIGLWLENNPFNCTCLSEQLLADYQQLLKDNAINPFINIFKTTCVTPSNYFGLSIFEFDRTCNNSYSRPYQFFINSTTTTTTTTTSRRPQTSATVFPVTDGQITSDLNGLSDAQIAGIVIGILLFVVLLIIFIIFLCFNELQACCFKNFPRAYRVFFKCWDADSDHKLENKFYDVFISYNQNETQWVKTTLLPYLTKNNVIRKYYLHYEDENARKNIYSSLIDEKLENSSKILLILSDAYLENEWNDIEFRKKVRTQVESKQALLACIQMTDVTDEELEEYVYNEIRLKNLKSYEKNEFCFWTKIEYTLKKSIDFNIIPEYRKQEKVTVKQPIKHIDDDLFDFRSYAINRPIIDLDNDAQRISLKKKQEKLNKALEKLQIDNDNSENDDDRSPRIKPPIKKYRKRNIIHSDSDVLSSNASIVNSKTNVNLFIAPIEEDNSISVNKSNRESRVLPLSAVLNSQLKTDLD